MITGGIVLFALMLTWLGGAFYAAHQLGYSLIATALGAGWLGIIYGALGRSAQRKNGDVESTRHPSAPEA